MTVTQLLRYYISFFSLVSIFFVFLFLCFSARRITSPYVEIEFAPRKHASNKTNKKPLKWRIILRNNEKL